ncbi:MAG: DUF4382 domain-containing protein [Chloroflexota bacterium]|nr:DUF4382 domain-containing protein [Chloroflexota bacterium]
MRRFSCVLLAVLSLFIGSFVFLSCSDSADETMAGKLQFKANGEDFVRQGFTSKDDWNINFDHVYISLAEVTAYQTEPPYDPHSGEHIEADVKVGLYQPYTVDLAEGDENAAPILIDEAQNAIAGHYNAVSWKLVKATEGLAKGYSLIMTGTAEKDGRSLDFTINIDEECEYHCGEYVGDERKGIITDGGTAEVEMTFHFDHIFGDADLSPDDDLNLNALGFEPFIDAPESHAINLDIPELHLGHVGEGHCHCE